MATKEYENYACEVEGCGRVNVKLWHSYSVSATPMTCLHHFDSAAQGSLLDSAAGYQHEWMVPSVPINPNNLREGIYASVLSRSSASHKWWVALPA